jgi:hypothetical protein
MSRGEVALLVGLLCWGCKSSGSRTTNTDSASLASKQLRLAFLRDYLTGPSEPEDAEFHISFHDNSGGFVPGPSDFDFQVALKVKPDDVSKWAIGCVRRPLEARPGWVNALLAGKAGWEVSSLPDSLRCGAEERLIHVHEGVVFRRLASQ